MRTIEQTKQIIETIKSTMSNINELTALLDDEYQQNHIDMVGEPSEQFEKMAEILRQSNRVLNVLSHIESDNLDDLQNPDNND